MRRSARDASWAPEPRGEWHYTIYNTKATASARARDTAVDVVRNFRLGLFFFVVVVCDDKCLMRLLLAKIGGYKEGNLEEVFLLWWCECEIGIWRHIPYI